MKIISNSPSRHLVWLQGKLNSTEKEKYRNILKFYYFIFENSNVLKALRYNSEGRGFDSLWCHWNFSLT
jgi:hypothetical protein